MSPPRTHRRDASPPRDQARSPFTAILEQLVASTPGARGAALVDFEGETVDYAGGVDPYELKVAAAHWLIVLTEISDSPLGPLRQFIVRARSHSYIIRQLQPGYAIVLLLHPRAAFSVSDRALLDADARICLEAGWQQPRTSSRWYGVDVEMDRGRPARLRGTRGEGDWQPVEVMGFMLGLRPREQGFRIRLHNGAEMLLVRERLGHWFADERVDG
ncbi:roadblock/LC7 domain-containing protein [Chondromyces crocatus]|uniref:Roadblock/LAMTOR2 domain-containing protein n=1 Tax=Chondromyces crocatus TaxID=52 RepID=A0A0K1EM00_CHOCO|nr:roadblock/LC7 domain-containing protein [Chondromyces crocatus]AKT41856.1 uncharacterized protein CMC5_060770 [Chondromyces crocatus]